jgi:hypothetical protein
MWPVPADTVLRRTLLIHELWHRVQADIGLPETGPSNAHLDTPDGRLWLQLEWRAPGAAPSARATRASRRSPTRWRFAPASRALPGPRPTSARQRRGPPSTPACGWPPSPAERATRARAAIAEAKRSHRSCARSHTSRAPPMDSCSTMRAPTGGGRWAAMPTWASCCGRRPGSRRPTRARVRRSGSPRPTSSTALRATEADASAGGGAARRPAPPLRGGPTLRLPLRSPKLSFDPHRVQPLDRWARSTVDAHFRALGVLDAPQGGWSRPTGWGSRFRRPR